MTQKLTPVATAVTAFATVMAMFALEISVVSVLRYFTPFSPPPDFITGNSYAHPFLALHVVGAVAALVLGPLQFITDLRERYPRFHRFNGRFYVAACALAAPAGFMLALGTQAGPVAEVGFAIPAILWPMFTYIGVKLAIARDFDLHRAWMLRAYAMAANAITLRLMLPLANALGISFMTSYPAIAWLGWIVNLALMELYIRRTRRFRVAQPVLAAA